MHNTFRYKLDFIPVLIIIMILMCIPILLYHQYYEVLKINEFNTEFIEWAAILIYIPVIFHTLNQISLRIVFKFEVESEEIKLVKPGLIRKFPFSAIGGFKKLPGTFNKKHIVYQFYEVNGYTPLFSINSSLIDEKSRFLDVVYTSFVNLEKELKDSDTNSLEEVDVKELEKREIFKELAPELTTKEVSKKYESIKNGAIILTVLSAVMLLSPLLSYFAGLSLLFPVVLIYFMRKNRQWVRLFRTPGGKYPFLIIALMLSSIAIVVHTSLLYHLRFNLLFWVYSTLFGGVYFFFILWSSFEYRRRQLSMYEAGFILVLCIMTGLGSITTINCSMDYHEPVMTSPKITQLIPEGPEVETEGFGVFEGPVTLPVYKSFYNTLEPEDHMHINLRPGLLGFQWFYEMNFD